LAETIIPPRFRPQHRAGLAAHLAGAPGAVINRRIEIMGLRADGSEIPVELTVTRAQVGDRPLFTAYLRDLSERNRARDLVAAAEQRQQLLLDAMPLMIWVTRADGYHEYFNKHWYDYTGTTPEQVCGDGWSALLHP